MKRFMIRFSNNSSNSNNTRIITRRNKSTSTSSSKSNEPSTDEKAAEISQEAWPTLKKYAPIIIPVLATSLYSGTTNNVYISKTILSLFIFYL